MNADPLLSYATWNFQSLLGHENSKTTEVYTHVTTKGFNQIQSPLDKLDK